MYGEHNVAHPNPFISSSADTTHAHANIPLTTRAGTTAGRARPREQKLLECDERHDLALHGLSSAMSSRVIAPALQVLEIAADA